MAGARHGMCELTARHRRGMDTAWARHAVCESAITGVVVLSEAVSEDFPCWQEEASN